MKWIILLVPLFIQSCSQEKEQRVEKTELPDKKHTETEQDFESYPDSICRILDEIGICKEYDCFDSTCCYHRDGIFSFYSLEDTPTKRNKFLLVAPGGSGGNWISIYSKERGKYLQIGEEFAFLDTVLTQSNLGMKDFQLVHRDYDRGYIRVLHRWDGKKYLAKKVIDVNNISIKILGAMKICEEDLNNPDGFIREYPGVSNMVYFELKMDTLFDGYDKSIYQIYLSDWQTKKTEKCWIIKRVGNQFTLLTVAGTSYLTYYQERGK